MAKSATTERTETNGSVVELVGVFRLTPLRRRRYKSAQPMPILFFLLFTVWPLHDPQTAAPPAAPALDFDFFKTRVQPIFLHKRQGLARCYVCHSQGTPFRLQPLAPGSSTWTDEESQKNFDAARRLVNAADPMKTPLLTMPLAAEAGGIAFHPGGKHWTSKDDPEWQTIAAWVRGPAAK